MASRRSMLRPGHLRLFGPGIRYSVRTAVRNRFASRCPRHCYRLDSQCAGRSTAGIHVVIGPETCLQTVKKPEGNTTAPADESSQADHKGAGAGVGQSADQHVEQGHQRHDGKPRSSQSRRHESSSSLNHFLPLRPQAGISRHPRAGQLHGNRHAGGNHHQPRLGELPRRGDKMCEDHGDQERPQAQSRAVAWDRRPATTAERPRAWRRPPCRPSPSAGRLGRSRGEPSRVCDRDWPKSWSLGSGPGRPRPRRRPPGPSPKPTIMRMKCRSIRSPSRAFPKLRGSEHQPGPGETYQVKPAHCSICSGMLR